MIPSSTLFDDPYRFIPYTHLKVKVHLECSKVKFQTFSSDRRLAIFNNERSTYLLISSA